MSGAIPLFPLYAFMARIGTSLPFTFQLCLYLRRSFFLRSLPTKIFLNSVYTVDSSFAARRLADTWAYLATCHSTQKGT
jgi:hypothetical protein